MGDNAEAKLKIRSRVQNPNSYCGILPKATALYHVARSLLPVLGLSVFIPSCYGPINVIFVVRIP